MAEVRPVPLEGINPNDMRIDRLGRVVITNPELARRLREIGPLGPDPLDLVAGNGICCGNGSCLSEELVSMLNRVVAGGRGG